MQGKLLLSKAGFMVPELGIALENIEVHGNSITDGSYTLEGRVSSAGGELTLTSEINNATGEDYAVTSRISGTKFEIINSPEIRALASPELDVIVTGTSTDVKGTIGISDALINLGEFRESVALSEDVVFKDRLVPEREQSRVTTAVQIEFGDRITIQGQGLSGKLTGTLDVYTNDSGELLGKGEVAIRDGRFSAYGQSLVIAEGKLIFLGNRLDNPELRVSAIQRIDDTITVGIKISGYASDPLVTLFSTPALGDDEILAYIVFGRPISSLTSGEGSDLIGAATAMGLRNSGFLTRSLSSTFGLDKLQFTSDSTGTNASLEIGKYLTPKLYLSYAMGVFERIATAQIRYDLNANWSLEVKSSTDVGVDLYYNIQK
jgi:translocation and assembly module TamB